MNLGLSWQQAAAGAAGLAIAAAALLRRSHLVAERGGPAGDRAPDADPSRAKTAHRLAAAGGFAREAALVLGLFALWQLAASLSVLGPDDALNRARWLWHAERLVHLPSEAALQRLILPHPLLVQVFDLYYDVLHFPVMIACLIWLFVRHRERYGQFRISLVAFTALCLLIQLIPVAPPRMLSGIGMVDTAARYGQSVYGARGGFDADQLSAMPSVHVGWAILVAIVVIATMRSRWRWLAAAYPVMTLLAVVVTANHFWLDGIAAAAVLALVLAAQAVARYGRDACSAGPPTAESAPADRVSRKATHVGGGLLTHPPRRAPPLRWRR
jgi:PAP2 superfamily